MKHFSQMTTVMTKQGFCDILEIKGVFLTFCRVFLLTAWNMTDLKAVDLIVCCHAALKK